MIRVILCRPEYQINLGMIARILQNFEVSDLYLVSPVARIGFEAIMFAKHGRKIIEDAKTVNSIEEAVKGCTLAVGTSGDVSKYKKKLKNSLPLKAAVEKTTTIAKSKEQTLALVFGAEGNGMTEEEFNNCDLITTIPTSVENPSLNLSNAVAIVLYEYFTASKKAKKTMYEIAQKSKTDQLEKMFAQAIESEARIINKEKVKLSFKRILERSIPEQYEVQSMLLAFAKILKKLKRN